MDGECWVCCDKPSLEASQGKPLVSPLLSGPDQACSTACHVQVDVSPGLGTLSVSPATGYLSLGLGVYSDVFLLLPSQREGSPCIPTEQNVSAEHASCTYHFIGCFTGL